MVTREELYRLIWAMPMTKASAQLGISYGKLVQICSALSVPRPAQGHWTRLELGKADPVPPLPAAAEGQPTTWTGDGMPLPKARPAARTLRKKAITGNKTPPAMHALLRGTKAQFLNSRPTRDDGFLRPYKRALPDLRTSSAALDRGLLLANALYNAFEEAGHHVVLSGLNSAARRLQIDPREAPIKGQRYDPYPQPWRPDRPTLVQTEGVSIGLIVLEMTEHVKMRYTNNGFVRDSPELAARLERSHGSGWTTFEDVPSGRLRIVAYAADSGIDWSQSWQELEDQTAPLSPEAIVKAVLAQKRQLLEMAEEAARRAELRHRAWLEEQEKCRRREDERNIAKSYEESMATLQRAIQRWSRVMEIEQFFSQAEQRAATLPSKAQTNVLERVSLARNLIGHQDPLDLLREWKAPAEIYQPLYADSADTVRQRTRSKL